MKLTATEMVTLDGVFQGPGGPDEDRRGGFDRGGWTAAYADQDMWPFLVSMFERADALLLGRKTWRDLAAVLAEPRRRSARPRHQRVAEIRAIDHAQGPDRQHTHVIPGDLEPAIRELKAKPGGELQLHGSGELLRWLLERDLVDELNLRIYPVIVGDGIRLFPEHGQSHGLEVIDSWSTSTGVRVETYRPKGRATFGNAG